MPAPELHTGWLDDVASAAVSGSSPFVLAVCKDLYGAQELREWLQTAIPSLAEAHGEEVPADSLWERLQEDASSGAKAWVVYDAAEGSAEVLQARWERFNLSRDRISDMLRSRPARSSVVFLATTTRMPEIVRSAPDLLSVCQVITVSEEPFAVDPQDTSMLEIFQRTRKELEARYGMTTEELVRRLMEREPTGVPEPDLGRWRSLAQALREVLE